MPIARPPLPESVPRDVQLTAAGRVLAAVGTLVLAGGLAGSLVLAGVSVRQAARARDLVAHGEMTTGVVTRLWKDGDNARRVEYRFSVDGGTFVNRGRVSAAVRRTLVVGSPLPVRYRPSAPAENDLGGPARAAIPLALPVLVAVIGTLFGVGTLSQIAWQRRLLAEGRLASGVVTNLSIHKGTHGSTHRTIRYEFTLLSGVRASGRSQTSSRVLAAGSAVWVVYDPDEPARNRLYPLSLVQASV